MYLYCDRTRNWLLSGRGSRCRSCTRSLDSKVGKVECYLIGHEELRISGRALWRVPCYLVDIGPVAVCKWEEVWIKLDASRT